MTFKITAKDKRLLLLLAVVLMVVGTVWLVAKPAVEATNTLKENITAANSEKMIVNHNVLGVAGAKKDIETLKEEIKTSASQYYNVMTNSEIDKFMTELALANGFTDDQLNSLLIKNDLSTLEFTEYGTKNKVTLSGVYAADVTIKLTGTHDQLQNIIDVVIANYPSIHVVSFTWGSENAEAGENLTLALQIFMTDK